MHRKHEEVSLKKKVKVTKESYHAHFDELKNLACLTANERAELDSIMHEFNQNLNARGYLKPMQIGRFKCSLRIFELADVNSIPAPIGRRGLADVVIICFDLTNPKSWENADDWQQRLSRC